MHDHFLDNYQKILERIQKLKTELKKSLKDTSYEEANENHPCWKIRGKLAILEYRAASLCYTEAERIEQIISNTKNEENEEKNLKSQCSKILDKYAMHAANLRLYPIGFYYTFFKYADKIPPIDSIDQSSQQEFIKGRRYSLGLGINQDFEKAIDCFRKSIKDDNFVGESHYELSRIATDVDYNKVDKKDQRINAVEELNKAMENGYPKAFVQLGQLYLNGSKIQKNIKLGLAYLEKAIHLYGDSQAIEIFARNANKSTSTKNALLHKSAYQNFPQAMITLSKETEGVQSLNWLLKLASTGGAEGAIKKIKDNKNYYPTNLILLTNESDFKNILLKLTSTTENNINKLYYLHMLLVCDIDALFDQAAVAPTLSLLTEELTQALKNDSKDAAITLSDLIINIIDLAEEHQANENFLNNFVTNVLIPLHNAKPDKELSDRIKKFITDHLMKLSDDVIKLLGKNKIISVSTTKSTSGWYNDPEDYRNLFTNDKVKSRNKKLNKAEKDIDQPGNVDHESPHPSEKK